MMRALLFRASLVLLAAAGGSARADGLADMKAALARASAEAAPLRATVDARSWRKRGAGSEADEERGQAALAFEQGARGLVVTHDRELLARIDAEQRARARNPDSKSPTVMAMDELGLQELAGRASSAAVLLRKVERGVYRGERAEAWQGRPARVLRFDMPITTLSSRDRKYARQFKAELDVWIGADGMPLASRLRQSSSGRAFVVVSFETAFEEDCVYALAGERLFTSRKETRSRASGAGEAEERRVVTALSLQS